MSSKGDYPCLHSPGCHTLRHVHAGTAGVINPVLTGQCQSPEMEMTDTGSHRNPSGKSLLCSVNPGGFVHQMLIAPKSTCHLYGPAPIVALLNWVSPVYEVETPHYDNLAPLRPGKRKAEGSSLGVGDRSQQGKGPEINKHSRILSSFWRKMRTRFSCCDLLRGKIMFPCSIIQNRRNIWWVEYLLIYFSVC